MWLLNTHTAELKFFAGPDDVPGGYATLSHVWGNPTRDENGVLVGKTPDEEDTFQKVRSVFEECQRSAQSSANAAGSQGPPGKAPGHTISSLSAQVDDLAAQVRDLTTQLQGLISAFQKHDPAIRTLLTTDRKRNPIPRRPDGSANSDSHIDTSPPPNARSHLSQKICNFLVKAEEHGFDWAWADTCCIDKTSSTELTEAINSMFLYYARCDVCYAYLSDVPSDNNVAKEHSYFQLSQWHTRGWTLQELFAPKTVIFMTKDWKRLGTKFELADFMEGSVRLGGSPPASVLRFEKDITEMSVAQRMSWAARRKTTRVEDEAYCLFGLFGVHIPTLYGEGRNAFYRLQEEIMRTSTDTSLFAWMGERRENGLCRISSLAELTGTIRSGGLRLGSDSIGHLLAPSPSHFMDMSDVITTGTWGNSLVSPLGG